MNVEKTILNQGYLDPLPPITADFSSIRDQIIGFRSARKPNPVYSILSMRDLHLCNIPLLNLILKRSIISVLRNVLGDDLIVWRSQIFYKEPHSKEIGWHQEWGNFKGEERGGNKASLAFQAPSKPLRSLTVWIPLQKIVTENGPLQMVPGSNRKQLDYAMVDFKKSAFYQGGEDPAPNGSATARQLTKGAYIPDSLLKDKPVVTFTQDAGQPIIFSERTLHRSLPNQTDQPRIAVNFRVVPSSTLVYPGRFQDDYKDSVGVDITNHKSILIAGDNLNSQNQVLDCRCIVQ